MKQLHEIKWSHDSRCRRWIKLHFWSCSQSSLKERPWQKQLALLLVCARNHSNHVVVVWCKQWGQLVWKMWSLCGDVTRTLRVETSKFFSFDTQNKMFLRKKYISEIHDLVFWQKIHRALNMTYEDVRRQRAEREKRFMFDLLGDVTGMFG